MAAPKDFISISQEIGSQKNLVQGAGGNTSYKEDNIMWVKASGTWLSEATLKDIFVAVDYKKIKKNIENKTNNPTSDSVISKSILRPSIETTLHALMPHKVVIHTHPVDVLTWLVAENGEMLIDDKLTDFSWCWIPYTKPGENLTNAIKEKLKNKSVDILFLQNHGLVVGGNSCDEAINKMNKLISKLKVKPRDLNVLDNELLNQYAKTLDMRIPKYSSIQSLALDEVSFNFCNIRGGVIFPDQAVFLGASIPCFNDLNAINKETPLLVIKDKGVFVSCSSKKDVDEILLSLAEVLLRLEKEQTIRYLEKDEISSLLDWDAEKYRQNLSE
jgi:rhamnose utilization protein RhaD (predicted bifunctional aldolase and dehydrogenase)